MDNLVRADWDDIFFDEELDAVSERLQKPERPDAIRSVAILDAAENFSLQHGNEREKRHKHPEDGGDIDQAGGNRLHPIRR